MVKNQVVTKDYALYEGDCIEVMPQIKDNSVGLVVYSPPFAGLYHYTSSDRDLSNSRTYEAFFEHYDFVIEQLHRITMKGRFNCVHCMEIPKNMSVNYLYTLPSDIIEAHIKCRKPNCTASVFDKRKGLCGHGWYNYVGPHIIRKEPLGVRNVTYAKKLFHQTIVEDSIMGGVASPDFLLMFQKKGKNEIPVTHDRGLIDYYGEREVPHELLNKKGFTGKQTANAYSQWIWRQYADCLWDDIRIDNVLPYKPAKQDEDEKHCHPLQLDVIARCIELRSNPGEIVMTPFGGVGSEPYQSVYMDRKAIAIELKNSYFNQMVKNVKKAFETKPCQLSLGLEI